MSTDNNEVQLGIQESVTKSVIWLNVSANIPTGFCTYDKEQGISVKANGDSVVGYVTAVTPDDKEYKGNTYPKLKFEVTAGDDVYVIQSGRGTNFSKSLVRALEMLRDQAENNGVTVSSIPVKVRANIVTNATDGEKYVFGELTPMRGVGNLEANKFIFTKEVQHLKHDDLVENVIGHIGSFVMDPVEAPEADKKVAKKKGSKDLVLDDLPI